MRALLTSNPRHFLDDSNDGAGRYDIYTADIWLFCEPLAAAIGPEWRTGFAGALALVDARAVADGSRDRVGPLDRRAVDRAHRRARRGGASARRG